MGQGKSLGVIPARYESKRFPGKALSDVGGIPLVISTYKNAMKANALSDVVIATDSVKIFDCAKENNANVFLSKKEHKSGTSRVCEVAEVYPEYEKFINIQGDNPYVCSDNIELLCNNMKNNDYVYTLASKIINVDDLINNNLVKTILDKDGFAIYFSRTEIPFIRGVDKLEWTKNHVFLKHIGIYGYSKNVLLKIKNYEISYLESLEKLEQLTWLYNNILIKVIETEIDEISIDCQEDLDGLIK